VSCGTSSRSDVWVAGEKERRELMLLRSRAVARPHLLVGPNI
jgi:hypothetical protein